MPSKRGYTGWVLTTDHEKAFCKSQPSDNENFNVTGLPTGCGTDALTEFLRNWKMHPLFCFRQGQRRTWVVGFTVEPPGRMFQHDDGLAIIKEHVMSETIQKLIERWQRSQILTEPANKELSLTTLAQVVKQTNLSPPGMLTLKRPRRPTAPAPEVD